jgi:hypothetical protein
MGSLEGLFVSPCARRRRDRCQAMHPARTVKNAVDSYARARQTGKPGRLHSAPSSRGD